MNRLSIFIPVLCCLFSSYLAGEEDKGAATGYQAQFQHTVVEGNNRFAFEFYEKIKQQSGNLCFSPYSIASGLAMVASGARGETADQFQHFFHFSRSLLPIFGDLNAKWSNDLSPSKSAPQIWFGNALWLQKDLPVIPSYKFSLKHGLGQPEQIVDFTKGLPSLQIINQWVSRETNGKINNLINDLDRNTRLLLTTAFYMKGGWALPFNPKETKRLSFHTSSQKKSLVEMLRLTSTFSLSKGEKWDLLVLPYARGEQGIQLAMALLLPKEGNVDELENQLTFENWKERLELLQPQIVAVTLPRFRIEKRLDLSAPLNSMGLSLIFTPEADLSGMTKEKGIFLNKALHKSMIRIDEKGTDFSSFKTPSEQEKTGETYEFTADRPFLFIIWDQASQAILLMGRLSLP